MGFVKKNLVLLFLFFWCSVSRGLSETPSVSPPASPCGPVLPSQEPSALSLKPGEYSSGGENVSVESAMLSHKAEYDLSLLEVYGDEDIKEVKGRLTIHLIDTGDGWAVDQKSNLIIYDTNGDGEQMSSTFLSWESKDGRQYRFYGRTVQNRDQEEITEGEALKNEDGHTIQVTYKTPEFVTFQIPGHSIFPTSFLVKSLKKAASGERVFSAVVFDGSSETRDPVAVNTVFGRRGQQNLIFLSQPHTPAQRVQFWPMNMAIYAFRSESPEAEYEISQTVMENGIIKTMTLDYGTFKVTATLVQADLLT